MIAKHIKGLFMDFSTVKRTHSPKKHIKNFYRMNNQLEEHTHLTFHRKISTLSQLFVDVCVAAAAATVVKTKNTQKRSTLTQFVDIVLLLSYI